MKIRVRTETELRRLGWQPCFLLTPRRARNSANQPLNYYIVGRAAKRRVARDNDNAYPYVWVYMDRTDAIAEQLGRQQNSEGDLDDNCSYAENSSP